MRHVAVTFVGFTVAGGLSLGATAANLYKWVDSDGNIVYQDTPPPGDVAYEEQAIPESIADDDRAALISEAAGKSPVVLYAIPDCDSCDVVRLALNKRGVPFLEKNAGTDTAVQQELMAKAGRLEVPTVVIGDQVVVGYSRSALSESLDAAGYPGLADATAGSGATGTGSGVEGFPDDASQDQSGVSGDGALEPALLDQGLFIPSLDEWNEDINSLSDEDIETADEEIGELKDELSTSGPDG